MIGYSNSALYLQNPGLAQALRRQAFAQQLATSATGSEPIRAHTQGLNKLAQAGLAALLMNRADSQFGEMAKKQEAERESFGALIGQMLSGGSGAQPAPAPQGGAPGIAPQAQGGVQVPPGIHMNESGGSMRPGIFGDGGLAAGPMQVHAAALADVNRRLGTNYTHQQLASDPQVGKLVGDEYWRMQHEKFGDPAKATAAYNAGPGRVAAAIQADPNNWQAGIPEATRGYVNRVHGSGQAAPQAGGMPDPNAELAKAQQMQMLGMQGMGSSDPTVKQQGEAVFQMGKQLEARALQIAAQQQARAERSMQTVTMQDPNGGGVGIYEMTPNGPGRRIGAAPQQQNMQTVQMQDPDGGVGIYEMTPNGPGRRVGSPPTPAQPGREFNEANTLRDEFGRLTSDFRVVQSAYENIRSAASSQSGAGDMSMLYSYVKLLDPTSVVRESEFATAAASGSFGERVQGAAQRIISGERMPDTLRDAFLKEARSIYTNQRKAHDSIADQYEALAKKFNLDPTKVVTRFSRPQEADTSMPIAGAAPGEFVEERPGPLPGMQQPAAPSGNLPPLPPGWQRVK